MEITLKFTETDPQSRELMQKLAELFESTGEPAPTEDHRVCEEQPEPETVEAEAPEPDPVTPAEPEAPKPEPEPATPAEPEPESASDTIDPEALRSQIRALGGKLTVAGKAEALMEVFKKHGSAKLSGLDAAALPEVLAELEAM